MDNINNYKTAMLNMKDEDWLIPFMTFVDDFRYYKDVSAIQELELSHERFDALIASTIEYLSCELALDVPKWVDKVPACKKPWFSPNYISLRGFLIVESHTFFRKRNIFVCKDFLYRV